jgi:hypothetical protein
MKNNARWIDRGLLVSPVRICVCVTDEQLQAVLRRMRVDTAIEFPAPCSGRTLTFVSGSQQICIVCINTGPQDGCHLVYGLIVHEVSHLWREIKTSLGEDNPGEEIEAYAQQMLFQHIAVAYDAMTKQVVDNKNNPHQNRHGQDHSHTT